MLTQENKTFQVSEFNDLIRNTLDQHLDMTFGIIGEIQSCKVSGNNSYLTLKDETSSLSVVFWKNKVTYKEGEKVQIIGKINLYQKTGQLNFSGFNITLIGEGTLNKQYKETFDKLNKLGYFNNKKPLPTYINNIGIITAKDGAALQDILYVLKSNNYIGNITIYNCLVQGINCPPSLIAGMKHFLNSDTKIDLLLITRGGGSTEDLMGFSDINFLEVLNNYKYYTISAVGHEVDNMLSDYVANYRAPTPSIAAEVISKTHLNLINQINELKKQCEEKRHEIKNYIIKIKELLVHKKAHVNNSEKMYIMKKENSLHVLISELKNKIYSNLNLCKGEISERKEKLKKLDNLSTGKVILFDSSNKVITSVNEIKDKQKIKIYLNGEYKEFIVKNV